MGFRRRIQEAPKIDLTPMVDVVFLLVIFFMLSTTFVEQPGLKINLPVSDSTYLNSQKQELRVYLAENGDIYLQRKEVTLTELDHQHNSYDVATAKKLTFILMADESTRHGMVVNLMDAAKKAGIGHLVIATDDKVKSR